MRMLLKLSEMRSKHTSWANDLTNEDYVLLLLYILVSTTIEAVHENDATWFVPEVNGRYIP